MAIRKANQPSVRLQEAGELGLVHPEARRAGVQRSRLEPICIRRTVAESSAAQSRKVDAPLADLEVEEAYDRRAPGLAGKQLGD